MSGMALIATAPAQPLERFHAARKRTRALFDLLTEEAFDARPIELRHPIRFYEGHIAAFNVNTLALAGLAPSRPEPALSDLFARGIDPETPEEAARLAIARWPARPQVAEYVALADEKVAEIIARNPNHFAVLTCIEHEEMHQETLLYLLLQAPHSFKRRPSGYAAELLDNSVAPACLQFARIPGGEQTLGASPERARDGEAFGWDNEFGIEIESVADFEIATRKLANSDLLAFVEAGGYSDPRWWTEDAFAHIQTRPAPPFWRKRDGVWFLRTLSEDAPLPLAGPALVSHFEARALARFFNARLPTEAEWMRAAETGGAHDLSRACDFATLDPLPVGRIDAPRDAHGVEEQVGNVWEWTASPFAPFSGFAARAYYPGYSADFFDNRHYVVKGASVYTARGLIRRGFRNWYRDLYPYALTGVRLAR